MQDCRTPATGPELVRRASIPEPRGGKRKRQRPTVVYSWIEQALLQALRSCYAKLALKINASKAAVADGVRASFWAVRCPSPASAAWEPRDAPDRNVSNRPVRTCRPGGVSGALSAMIDPCPDFGFNPALSMHWQTSRFDLDLTRPVVMGIVNVTPDSFSDGGQHASRSAAAAHCERLLSEGAQILDIGGESTRPGASPVSLEEELARVLPVLRHAVTLGVPVSVDTSQPRVMQAALDLGADIINDVRSLHRPGALQVVAQHPRAGVCLMHMRGEPGTMQAEAERGYDDVVQAVCAFLADRVRDCEEAGIQRARLAVDPGIGFAKTAAHNLRLLREQGALVALGLPVLAGWSRKGTLGRITGRPVGDRLVPSVAAALLAAQHGALVLRVHDVAATVDALRLWQAMRTA